MCDSGVNNNSKRKRSSSSSLLTATASDLSETTWCYIADFLPQKTSRALLAVALTAPSASWRATGWKGRPCGASKAIIDSTSAGASFEVVLSDLHGNCDDETVAEIQKRFRPRDYECYPWPPVLERAVNDATKQLKEYYDTKWEVLDFADIERSLESRLTDDDIGAILVCIDAKNHLKRLKLRNNFDFVGHGLQPLCGSNVLEALDLGLTGKQLERTDSVYEIRDFNMVDNLCQVIETKLSECAVCDVVESILESDGNSFKRLQLPCKFWTWSVFGSHFEYNNARIMKLMEDHGAWLNNHTRCLYFQSRREDLCLYFENKRLEGDVVQICYVCMREGCSSRPCSNCQVAFCSYCADTFGNSRRCDECGVQYCHSCYKKGFKTEVTHCGGYLDYHGCDRVSCSSCLVHQLRNNNTTRLRNNNTTRLRNNNASRICPLCYKTAFGILDEMNNANEARLREQQEQNIQLQHDLDALRTANSST